MKFGSCFRCSVVSLRTIVVILCFGFFLSSTSFGGVSDPTFGTPVTALKVPLGHARILVFDDVVKNVSLGNPKVADVIVLESQKLYVVGKSLGSTNVVVWGRGSRKKQDYTTFRVEVTHDLESLKKVLHEIMPDETPEIKSSAGAIVLSGEVSSPAKILAIETLAKQYVKNAKKHSLAEKKDGQSQNDAKEEDLVTEVINLMSVGGPHQVMLEVKVAEISRSIIKRLGINLASFDASSPWKMGAVNGGASFPNAQFQPGDFEVPIFPTSGSAASGANSIVGPNVDLFEPTAPAISATGLFFNYLSGNTFFNLVIDAAKEDGLAKILAEPTLTTASGEAASFLSGGEFPIPVWSGDDDKISIKFKEFGISMKALPLVQDTKRISINLEIAVSELTDAASIAAGLPTATSNFAIPSLSTRRANSTVELLDGQTIGIAGLISDKMRETVNKFPGLGDIPILGTLFRSQEWVQDQTELVMFVTARLAQPIKPDQIRLPTDAFVEPTDAEFFLLGRMEGFGGDELIDRRRAERLIDPNFSLLPSEEGDFVAPKKALTEEGEPSFGHQL